MQKTYIRLSIIASLFFLIVLIAVPNQLLASVYEGIVMKADSMSICMQGETHLLTLPCFGDLVVYLKSDRIDLDSYVGENVKVSGPIETVECDVLIVRSIKVVPLQVECCIGNFDGDGDVDGADLATFATDFGRTNCNVGPPCEGDFDKDGDVDGKDLAIFAYNFGRTDCSASIGKKTGKDK